MLSTPQILTIIGLILEFVSVGIALRKLFWGYYERIENAGASNKTKERSEKTEGTLILIFLIIGMGLQGLAVVL